MQQALDLWNSIAAWLSQQWDGLVNRPGGIWRQILSSLWEWSLWLQAAHKGLIIALILLVLIVNSILKRRN